MPTKQQLRQQALAARRALAPADRADKSRAIAQRVLQLPEIQNAPEILTYLALPDEVDTTPIINELLRQGHRVLAPAIDGDHLRWYALPNPPATIPGPHNIPQPDPAACDPAHLDPNAPVLIPCVAFTDTGHRLGFGKGYYDRFLATHPGPKIALAFDLQRLQTIPTDPHDIPMDIIVTVTQVMLTEDRE